MKLHFVETMDEVLKIALEREVVALPMPANPVNLQRQSRTSEEKINALRDSGENCLPGPLDALSAAFHPSRRSCLLKARLMPRRSMPSTFECGSAADISTGGRCPKWLFSGGATLASRAC